MTDSIEEIREIRGKGFPDDGQSVTRENARAVIFFYLIMFDLGAMSVLQSADSPFRDTGWEAIRFMMPFTVVMVPLLFIRPERIPTWTYVLALAPGALLAFLAEIGCPNLILVMSLALSVSETAYCIVMIDIVSVWFSGNGTDDRS
ncbi:MAG: hypothetical protein HGA31_06935 [Candidatus Moranbacteria bacterium]|nr:hypothetical protein [Candidatus Moranbacteria bacterium]